MSIQPNSSSYQIRLATVSDAPIIAHHRVAMFLEIGQAPTDELTDVLLEASIGALRTTLQDGSYIGWLAVAAPDRSAAQEEVIAGAGIHIKPQLPRLSADRMRVEIAPIPLVVNVYTKPLWRRQGVARALMNAVMQWANEHDCDRVLLHASDGGRPLYEALGFVPTNEMRWTPKG